MCGINVLLVVERAAQLESPGAFWMGNVKLYAWNGKPSLRAHAVRDVVVLDLSATPGRSREGHEGFHFFHPCVQGAPVQLYIQVTRL